jgi:hypothetical protein
MKISHAFAFAVVALGPGSLFAQTLPQQPAELLPYQSLHGVNYQICHMNPQTGEARPFALRLINAQQAKN